MLLDLIIGVKGLDREEIVPGAWDAFQSRLGSLSLRLLSGFKMRLGRFIN